MLVQRGETTVDGTIETITLDTPVKVGESFIIQTVRGSDSIEWRRFLSKTTLKTIIDGHYTQLEFRREDSTGNMIVAWEVITGSQFKVQMIERVNQGDEIINEVDLNKSFIITTNSSTEAQPQRDLMKAKFTNSTAVNFERYLNAGTVRITAYIVEWEGASVQSGESVIADGELSNTETINEVNLDKSFIISNWRLQSTSVSEGTSGIIRTSFNSSTEALFDRQASSNNLDISYFVVEHSNIEVISNTPSMLGTSNVVNETIDEVDLGRTFLGFGYLTNMKGGGDTALNSNFINYILTSETNLKMERSSIGAVNPQMSYFIIKLLDDDDTRRRTALAYLIA